MRCGAQVVGREGHTGVPGELLAGMVTVAKWTGTHIAKGMSDE